MALIKSSSLRSSGTDPADLMSEVTACLEEAFSYRGGFLRIGGSDKSLEVGQWWLRETSDASAPLSDRVERELVKILIERPRSSLLEIIQELCNIFPGLLTPSTELIQVCLESYAEQAPPESGHWQLRDQDAPQARRADLVQIQNLLAEMAIQMGYSPHGEGPLLWHDKNGELRYAFYVLASAIISDVVFTREYPPEQCLVIIPGGRANLVAYKIHHDPRLRQAVETGWRFVKYRQLRRLAESPLLISEALDDHFSQDELTLDTPQLHLF